MSTYTDASLIVTPNSKKAGKLYALKGADLDVVRATTATYVDVDSLIKTALANEVRFDYTNASCPSILVEPQRTNAIKYSSDLSQSIWLKTNYTLSTTTTIQGLNATRITKNSTSNGLYNSTGGRNLIHNTGVFDAGVKTLSFLIRKGNTEKIGFLINNVLVGALTALSCEFNFNTKTFTNVSLGLSVSYENPLTDVYKIIITINDIGTLTTKQIWIAPIDSSNNTVTGGYVDIAYAQWELGSNATSYIPTVASTVTRNADVISKTGISDLIGQTEGAIFVEFNKTKNNTSILSIDDGTTNNRIFLEGTGTSTGLRVRVTNGGTTTVDNTSNVLQNGINKIALVYANNNVSLYRNGILIFNDNSATIPNTSILRIGSNVNNLFQLDDSINSAVLWKTALTNQECIDLTTL